MPPPTSRPKPAKAAPVEEAPPVEEVPAVVKKSKRPREVVEETHEEPAAVEEKPRKSRLVEGADGTPKPAAAKAEDAAAASPIPTRKSRAAAEETAKAAEATGGRQIDGSVARPLEEFSLSKGLIQALHAIKVTSLFPVQQQTLAAILKGTDVLVQSRTGSGKTLAYSIPMMERIASLPDLSVRGRGPAAVVFCPTRELAIQVADVLKSISRLFVVAALYGGVAYATQERQLTSGVDVVVATPGRAKDMLEKGMLRFDRVRIVCLDEADHMLDIGFKDDIELLLHQVAKQNGSLAAGKNSHQTLLFSATVPQWVHTSNIVSKDNTFIDLVGKEAVKTANTIRFYRRKCLYSEVQSMLADLIRVYAGKHGRTLVFTNTKKDCHDLTLNNALKLDAQSLHGDMQQDQREVTMKSFRENKFAVLVATDVAARGLDLPMVDLVIQAAPPTDIDSFIHRAGRTGRAGRQGVCVLLHSMRDEHIVQRIENHARIKFEVLPPPSRAEILKAVVRDVTEELARVERKATEIFRAEAELILKEADPVEILASALCVMSGYTETVAKRGLLTGVENFTTVQITMPQPATIPMLCGILRRELGDELFMRCRDITLLQNEPGCCFDVPEMFAKDVLDAKLSGMKVKEVTELPPVIARDRESGAPPRWGGGRGGSFAGAGRGGGYGAPAGRGGFAGRGGGAGSGCFKCGQQGHMSRECPNGGGGGGGRGGYAGSFPRGGTRAPQHYSSH